MVTIIKISKARANEVAYPYYVAEFIRDGVTVHKGVFTEENLENVRLGFTMDFFTAKVVKTWEPSTEEVLFGVVQINLALKAMNYAAINN